MTKLRMLIADGYIELYGTYRLDQHGEVWISEFHSDATTRTTPAHTIDRNALIIFTPYMENNKLYIRYEYRSNLPEGALTIIDE